MIAAPSATALMADLGADVVKVEPPTGDILRNAHRLFGPAAGPGPLPDAYFTLDNRGKQSIAVDLARPEGATVVHRLAEQADIFLTNLTDERRERYRVTSADVLAVNPTIVYTLLTGYGTSGPLAGKPAYDWTAFFARGGVSSVIGEPGAPPPGFRPGQGDHTTALALLASTLAALRERDRTGVGLVVEVALYQVAAWTMASDLSVTLVDGSQPHRPDRSEWPSPLTCRFRCGDGRWIAFCMPGPRDFWDSFCVALDRPEWTFDDRFETAESRMANAALLISLCDEAFAAAPREHWADRFDEAGLVWAPSHTLPEVVNDPQSAALGMFEMVHDPTVAAPFRTVAAPFHILGADVAVRGPAPALGAHSRSVLGAAGFDDDEVARLLNAGVVTEG